MATFANTFNPQDINQEVDEFGRPIDVVQDSVDALGTVPEPDATVEPNERPYTPFRMTITGDEEGVEGSGGDALSLGNPSDVDDLLSQYSTLDEVGEGDRSVDSLLAEYATSATVDKETDVDSLLREYGGLAVSDTDFVEAPFDKYEEGGLTKELALKDTEVMDLMKQGLEFRFGSRGAIRGAAVYALGGAGGGYTDKMEDEDVFEMWQNWMRSFAGGQTTTVANELAFTTTLDDEQKGLLGAQYLMFDKNPNIFSAKASWSETFDGMRDYATAAIWDPMTLVSFGVGKALGAGGTKVAASAIRQAAVVSYRESLKKGVGHVAARAAARSTASSQFVKTGAVDLAKYSAVDFVANISSDILYQNQLIDTGAQEEYSSLQTGVAALATIMLPAIVGSSKAFAVYSNSKNAPAGLRSAVDVTDTFKGLTKEVIDERLQARIDWTKFDNEFSETAQDIAENSGEYIKWGDAKLQAAELLGDDMSLSPVENNFMRSFLYGPADGSKKGFVQAMSDSGLVYVPRGEDDKITNFIGDAISWVPPETMDKFIKGFNDEFGEIPGLTKLEGTTSSEQVSAFWKLRQSNAGDRLRDSSYAQYILRNNLEGATTSSSVIKALSRSKDTETPKEIGKYVLSLYKSLLTSHFGTTGLNLKGWSSTVGLNTMSDFVQGSLEIATAPLVGRGFSGDAYDQAVRRGRGSVTGAMRRGVLFLQPEDTIEKALAYMTYRPDVLSKLSKDLGGDSGARAGSETLDVFGIPDNKLTRGLEGTRNTFQTLTGVKLQDELTKMLSWQSNLELMIRREYGKGYNEFMEDPALGFIEMNSPKYRNKVEASALDRTLRETYSLEWSTKKGSGLALSAARGIEKVSSNAVAGYSIPFGKFFNTSIAMMSDYAFINAARAAARPMLGKKSDLASEDLAQLISKTAVGATVVWHYSDKKLENLAEGLSWNQERNDDGSISDETYNFPMSVFHLTGMMVAHYRKDGEVPMDLAEELVDLVAGSTFKGSADAVEVASNLGLALGQLDSKEVKRVAVDSILNTAGRIFSGFTRTFEPLNLGSKAIKGDFSVPDRNTSGDSWTDWSLTKKSTRYIDEFFSVLGAGSEASPRAASPTEPEGQVPNVGNIFLGARGTSGNSLSETLLASVGRPSWKVFRWGGDADVKNFMNNRVSNIFEEQSAMMLGENPNFFDLPLATREYRVDQVISRSRELTIDYLESNGGDLSYLKRLDAVNKKDLSGAMEFLGVEGNPKDLLDLDNGVEKLGMLLDWAENFDEYAIRD